MRHEFQRQQQYYSHIDFFFFFFFCERKIREMWKINFCSIEIEWIRIPFIWKFYILWLIARKPSRASIIWTICVI